MDIFFFVRFREYEIWIISIVSDRAIFTFDTRNEKPNLVVQNYCVSILQNKFKKILNKCYR